MPSFNSRSMQRLETCHPDLVRLFLEVVRHHDCTVLEGHRGMEGQNQAYRNGHSNLKWPHGKHNTWLSTAVDVAPWPLNWDDRDSFLVFGGLVLGIASQMQIPVRWGYDWDQDWDLREHQLQDGPHFELVEPLLVEPDPSSTV